VKNSIFLASAHKGVFLRLLFRLIITIVFVDCLGVTVVSANGGVVPENYPDAALINAGRELFFNETFDGNGRTCGTCHPEDNNFTIDPRSISKLPADDPLFIAERDGDNPLAYDFEKPELMRQVGLILENTDGFDDLEHNFTMRSVPHMLAMRTSITAPSDNAYDGTAQAPLERTGWSGDGSPTNLSVEPPLLGTLRDFTVGAISQHFTKTLNREAGVDFRLPTQDELDALEAFMLSLGRQEEFDDFSQIVMSDERADMGRRNYMGEDVEGVLNCNACHFNGGANTNPDFDFPTSVTPSAFEATNRSFTPRVEELIDQPGDLINEEPLPYDDGFGSGSDLFNAPTVIEAADTGPFFHANQFDTVEGLVSFYATQRHLINGEVLPPIVGLHDSQISNIGAFLRVLNADENARSSIDLINRAKELDSDEDRDTNLYLANTEIDDALEVLAGGNLHSKEVVPLFKMASQFVGQRRLNNALENLHRIRSIMVDRSGVL